MATSTKSAQQQQLVIIIFMVAMSLVVSTEGQAVIPPPALAPSPLGAATPAPYYISYGALTANRAPCPSGTGRSYYTQNCTAQSGYVTPYTRSCIQITRCARG